jgi:hypothetical protein
MLLIHPVIRQRRGTGEKAGKSGAWDVEEAVIEPYLRTACVKEATAAHSKKANERVAETENRIYKQPASKDL